MTPSDYLTAICNKMLMIIDNTKIDDTIDHNGSIGVFARIKMIFTI